MKKFFVFFFLASLVFAVSVKAIPVRTVGVYVGDWFKYEEFNVTWSSNDPNASKFWYGMDLEMYNQTEWVQFEITEVSGTNITTQMISHFKNGTEETMGGWVDIDTGEGVNATSMLISANLDPGDPIYTAGDYSNWFLNETVTREYPDNTRETNHINLTYGPYNYTMPPDVEVYYRLSIDFYWDKTTGVIVEDCFQMTNQTGQYLTEWSMAFKITESNSWVIPEFPNLTIWLAVIGTTSLVMILIKRKLKLMNKPGCEPANH